MRDSKKPTPRDRQVGNRLRLLREAAGLTVRDAAVATGISGPTLNRMENGRRRISTEEIAMITTAYQRPVEERQELIEFARSGDSGGWWERPIPGVPEEMGTLASFEAESSSLTDWSLMLVPGLLQTEDYARAVWLTGRRPSEDADLRWVARRRRQQVLGRVDYTAYIYEGALSLRLGGPDVHRQQIQHLLAARDRGIAVRIVRHSPILAVLSHSWLYMTFPGATPMVNVEVYGGGFYLQDDRVEPYTRWVKVLADIAVSRSETEAMLHEELKEAR